MYEVAVESSFCATHSLRLADGGKEPLHGHDWTVTATFGADKLDPDGMVVDFHAAEELLRRICGELHHTHLDDHRWFKGSNPTAENVACVIFRELERNEAWQRMLRSVRVGEAPGCSALFALSVHRSKANTGYG